MSKLLLVLLLAVLAFSIIGGMGANGQEPKPSFGLDFQFQVFTVDLKTETVYSSNYNTRMWTWDPSVQSFEMVMLRPDYNDAIRFLSGNVSGNQQVYEQIQTDPTKVTTPWEWHLTAKRFLLGSPFDYYEFSFLFAVNMSVDLEINNTWIIVPFSMRGDWSYEEHPMVQQLTEVPDNQTLANLGLSSQKFYQYGCQNMADFYLITIRFGFPIMYSARIAFAFLVPSITILLVLLVALAKFKKISTSNVLTLFLGVGLFILTFVVSFYQYAPSRAFTWQEAIFYLDFFFVTGLAVAALLRHKKSTEEESNGTQSLPASPQNEGSMSGADQLRVQRMFSELSTRESSTLVISTIAASLSLAVFAVVLQFPSTQLSDLAFVIGIMFPLIGFVYREVTVFFIDRYDYKSLKTILPLTPYNRLRDVAIFLRMLMVRFLLLIPFAAWWEICLPPESREFMLPVSTVMILGVALALSLVEHLLRNNS